MHNRILGFGSTLAFLFYSRSFLAGKPRSHGSCAQFGLPLAFNWT